MDSNRDKINEQQNFNKTIKKATQSGMITSKKTPLRFGSRVEQRQDRKGKESKGKERQLKQKKRNERTGKEKSHAYDGPLRGIDELDAFRVPFPELRAHHHPATRHAAGGYGVVGGCHHPPLSRRPFLPLPTVVGRGGQACGGRL